MYAFTTGPLAVDWSQQTKRMRISSSIADSCLVRDISADLSVCLAASVPKVDQAADAASNGILVRSSMFRVCSSSG